MTNQVLMRLKRRALNEKILNLICSAAAALMISGTAMAADMNLPPEQLVESVSVEVLEQIKRIRN